MTITLATPLTLWWHWRQHRRNSSNSSNKTSERIETSKFWRIWRESACSSISRWTDNKLSTRIFLEYNWSGKSKERKALANWTRIFGKWTLERGDGTLRLFDTNAVNICGDLALAVLAVNTWWDERKWSQTERGSGCRDWTHERIDGGLNNWNACELGQTYLNTRNRTHHKELMLNKGIRGWGRLHTH